MGAGTGERGLGEQLGHPSLLDALWELGKGDPRGRFQSPLVPQPGRRFGSRQRAPPGVADLLSALKGVQRGQETLSLRPPHHREPRGSQRPLFCRRPDPGSESPGAEGFSGFLPDRGAPRRHDGPAAQVRYRPEPRPGSAPPRGRPRPQSPACSPPSGPAECAGGSPRVCRREAI